MNASPDVRPVQRRSLADQVADQLRDLILLEELPPGSPIVERETASALGVSRTPLRESLRLLASEGLVEIQPNRVPRVADPSLDEIKELLLVLMVYLMKWCYNLKVLIWILTHHLIELKLIIIKKI